MTHRKPRVLIADDHVDLVKTLTRVLSTNYEIAGSVADGRAVFEAAQRLQPDVIVLDLSLPNVNGFDACQQITQANPKTKVIVYSAMDDPSLRQRAFEVGAVAFVCKVTADADLLTTLNRLCGDRSAGTKDPASNTT